MEDHQINPNNNNYNNNNNRNRNNYHQQQNRRQETARAYAAVPAEGKVYAGNLPNSFRPPVQGVYPYKIDVQWIGEKKEHFRNRCPKAGNRQNVRARARAYAVVENPQQNPNVVASTFLLNDHYACILFDSGAEKSFFLEVQGERPEKNPGSLAYIKADEKEA
ncbi:hypothetical protein Tco_0421761 [Tanacetum coccineum]